MKKRDILLSLTGLIFCLLIILPIIIKNQSSSIAAIPEQKSPKHLITLSQQKVTDYPVWDKEAIYLGGDLVIYKKKIYQAKWWTQGEIPGKTDVWKDTLETIQTPQKQNSIKKEKSRCKVIAYYPSWKTDQLDKLQYNILTHIIYAFAIPNADGTLRPLENPDLAKQLITRAHQENVQVLLAVGGWSYNDTPLEATFLEATKTKKKQKTFAKEILALCDKYGFDGIDIDWEHPRVDGNSAKQYEGLINYLSKELHKKEKLITSAVISGATPDGNIYYDAAAHTDKVLKCVDWINVMAYDGGDGERHSTYEFAIASASYWKKTRKMPASKIVLGVPFYARPSWATYEDLLAVNPLAYKKDNISYNGIDVYYNGIKTIKKKAKYAKKHLGGIMIWEITQDSAEQNKSLLSAIGKAIQ